MPYDLYCMPEATYFLPRSLEVTNNNELPPRGK